MVNNMIVNCVLTKNIKQIENIDNIIVYGIQCFSNTDFNTEYLKINDISLNPLYVYNLVEKINVGQLCYVHIMDVVYDYITT